MAARKQPSADQVKQVWTPITDPDRAKAIMAVGKYREDKPFWVVRDGVLWLLKKGTTGNRNRA